MSIRKTFAFLLLMILMSVLGGCSSTRPSCRPTSRPPFPGEGTRFDVETLEFDDFGVDCTGTQLGRVLKRIRENNAASPNNGALTVVFVHGWHNGPVSGNLKSFVTEFLTPLADNERKRNPHCPRKILGVYVAWRAARWKGWPDYWPGSYFDRGAAAKRIANGDVLQDLVAIMTTVNENEYSRSIFFGHSLGGLILERAFTTALRSYIAKTFAQDDEEHVWDPPADLVVSMNPAATAMEAWRFKRLLRDWKIRLSPRDTDYTEGSPRPWVPLLVNIVSEGDWATSALLRVASTLGNHQADFGAAGVTGRPLAPVDEKRLLRFSPGFTCDLLTHVVIREPAAEEGLIPQPCTADHLHDAQPAALGKIVRFGTTACAEPALHRAGDPRACTEVCGDRFHLLEIDRAGEAPLYWIMRVPNDVIVGHSSFFTVHSRNLFAGLVTITDAMAASPSECAIPRSDYAMTAEGQTEWLAAEVLRKSMFGMQRVMIATGGPPGVCELPPDIGFRVEGACSGTSETAIVCSGTGDVTLTAEPASLAQSECATIEWQIGDAKSRGLTATYQMANRVQVMMTVKSDRAPVIARAFLALPEPRLPKPGEPSVTYRGERSGCTPGGVPCQLREDVTFTATAERNDPPIEWELGGGPSFGSQIVYRFTMPGRHRVAALARNRSGATPTYFDVDVASCDRPPAPVAILYRGESPQCTEITGDCVAGELVTYNVDAPPDDCATVEWHFANGDVVKQREVERILESHERARVSVTTPDGVSNATAMLTSRPRVPISTPTPPPPCATCCTFRQKRETTHTVMPGDWLSKIALAQYRTLDWSRIYDRNRNILKHPDRIRPGQILRVPICDQ